jgi:hypothetical protein
MMIPNGWRDYLALVPATVVVGTKIYFLLYLRVLSSGWHAMHILEYVLANAIHTEVAG